MKTFKAFIEKAPNLNLDPKELFGDVLFGEIDNFYGTKREYDTPAEKQVLEELLSFIRGRFQNKEKSVFFLKILDRFMGLKKSYPDVLKPSKQKYYYRKIITTYAKLLEFIAQDDLDKFKNVKYPEDNLFYQKPEFIYKPMSKVQSWSTELLSADEFVPTGSRGSFNIILRASIPDKQLLFNSNFLNVLGDGILDVDENEVVRYSKSPLKCEFYMDTTQLSQLRMDLKV